MCMIETELASATSSIFMLVNSLEMHGCHDQSASAHMHACINLFTEKMRALTFLWRFLLN